MTQVTQVKMRVVRAFRDRDDFSKAYAEGQVISVPRDRGEHIAALGLAVVEAAAAPASAPSPAPASAPVRPKRNAKPEPKIEVKPEPRPEPKEATLL